MAEAFVNHGTDFRVLGFIALLTALLTAYYTFRVWFRVCAGKPHYELGDDHHGDDHGHGITTITATATTSRIAPRLAINGVLIIIAAALSPRSFAFFRARSGRWRVGMVEGSSAVAGVPHEVITGDGFWADPHKLCGCRLRWRQSPR